MAGLDDTEEADGKAAYRGIRRVSSSMACRCSCPEQGRVGAQSARHNHNDTRDTGDGADDAVVHRVHGADARRADMQYRTVYRDARDESGAADISHLLSLRAHLHNSGVRQDTRDIQDSTEFIKQKGELKMKKTLRLIALSFLYLRYSFPAGKEKTVQQTTQPQTHRRLKLKSQKRIRTMTISPMGLTLVVANTVS